jgi:hypothetical protein
MPIVYTFIIDKQITFFEIFQNTYIQERTILIRYRICVPSNIYVLNRSNSSK